MSFCDVEVTPIKEWQRLFDINCLGQVRMIQAFLPLLRRSQGRIVNIASTHGAYLYTFLAFEAKVIQGSVFKWMGHMPPIQKAYNGRKILVSITLLTNAMSGILKSNEWYRVIWFSESIFFEKNGREIMSFQHKCKSTALLGVQQILVSMYCIAGF